MLQHFFTSKFCGEYPSDDHSGTLCRSMENGLNERLIVPKVQEEETDLKSKILQESKNIWRVALPGVISRVGSFGTIVVTQSFIGHISPLDLAGYALVQTITVRFVNGILVS